MNQQSPLTAWRRTTTATGVICRTLGSLKLAIALLATLATVLGWGTFLEAGSGRELAQWYVYTSSWFVGLLGFLGVNILASTAVRFPWKRRQIGFVVTHVGLLVLLAGAFQTFMFGVEGQLVLSEGERGDKLLMPNRSQIVVERSTDQGRVSSRFTFAPGAVDWPEEKSLDFGQAQGLGLTVKKFYRHASPQVNWIADQKDFEGPALQLRLLSHQGYTVGEDWLAASPCGGEAIIGPTMYVLLPVPVETMVDDFLNPPTEDVGEAGVLSVHHAGRSYRLQVDKERGRKIPIGDGGVEIEIVDYLPDARPSPNGSFVSRSFEPKNPVLELKIHLPDRERPMRQMAFAKRPLLSLDAAYGRECPVRFWYHHPQTPWVPGAVFLQTLDGRLFCRAVVDGAVRAPQEVQAGSTISLGGQFTVSLEKHIARARQQVSFTPVEAGRGPKKVQDAAAEIEISITGQRRRIWLSRADEQYGYQSVLTPQGVVTLTFGYEQLPIGFTVELQDFVRSFNPGRSGNATFASRVQLLHPTNDISETREISMNQPLTYGKFTLYQSSFEELADGEEASVLTAVYDPGRFLKYLGSLMVCAGIFTMFYTRAYMFQNLPSLHSRLGTREATQSTHSTAPSISDLVVPNPLGLHRTTTEVDAHISR